MIPHIHMPIMMLAKMMLIVSLIFFGAGAYRIKGDADETKHFVPYEIGNVGNVHQFTTAQTWLNQGYTDSIVLGDNVGKNRLTSCPKMIGPINDEYFCSDIEKGYCDRRSGTCFCNDGYMGDACDECAPTHVKRGGICYPKTPCPNNCSRFGECNFQTGICECSEFREGADCSQPKCSRYHEFCKTCDEDGCIECEGGWSSHKTAEWGEQCQPCWRFDPRCRTCSEEACTSCVDLLLLSIHRSGRRPHDPPLPVDELMRELSVTVPFGSTQEDAFYDAEHYFLVDSSMAPLNESAVECHQGLNNDASISCTPYNLTSHIICGNHGTITFDSPEYAVREDENHVRLILRRSGGGVGEVTVSYSVYPITAGYEDVSSTAYYTTNRTVVFQPGQITASFLVTINDDRIMEPDEIFSVHLSNPTGGASLGTQQRTIVTIIDDDSDRTCSHAVVSDLGTTVQQPTNIGVAGDLFDFNLFANTCAGSASTEGGGDMFKIVVRKLAIEDSHHTVDATGSCEHALENAYYCSINATASGDYKLDVYHLIPGGLKGYYFTDNFLDGSRLDMVRIDASLNFTWGTGPVTRFARDYLSVRWEGYVRPMHSETYSFWLDVDDHARLWIDGNLLIDWWTFPAAPSSMLYAEYKFTALETYEIVLEYRDILGNATSRLLWSSDSTPITAIPSSSLYYREPIQGSPFDCVILPAATDVSQSRAVGEEVHHAIAGQQHTFTVIPNDAFGNFRGWPLHSLKNDERHLEAFHATAQLLDINEREIDASINFDVSYDESSRKFYLSYNPISSGFYQLNVTYDAMHISGSPFSLDVVPGITFAQESIAFGSVLEFGMAGELFTASIQSFDANRNKKLTGGDDWKVTLTSVITNEYEYGRVEDHSNGTYTLHVVPRVAGPNDLSITLNGGPIRGSPFRMNVEHNEVDGSSSFIANKAEVSTMIAMQEAMIIIQANDSWGNKIKEPYNTSIMVRSDSIDEDATSVRYIGGGTYEITVMPVISGEEIYLEIILNGMNIVDSPLLAVVQPGNFSATTSIATGSGLRRAEAGVEASFFVQSKDEGGNNKVLDEAIFNVTLTLVEKAGIPTDIESQIDNTTDEVVVQGSHLFTHDGQYAIQYTCFVAGLYDLYISDDKGNSVVGSPFRVQVVPSQLSGEHSFVTGEGTIQGVAGKVAPVRLFPRDQYGNFIYDSQETVEYELSLQSRHQSSWEELDEQTQSQLVRASGDGSFNLDYVTGHAGNYSLIYTTFLPGGLEASYFSSPDFSPDYLVFSTIEDNVDTNWSTLSYSYTCAEEHACDNLLSNVIGPYHVAAKWTGKLKADVNEEYTIRVDCNDGGQTSFTIDGLHSSWQSCWPYAETRITLPTNGVDLLLKYKNYDGVNPFIVLKWSSSASEGNVETIPSSNLLYHQIVGNTTFYPTIYPDSVYAPNSIAIGDSLRHAVSGIEQEFLVECKDRHGNLLLDEEKISLVSSGYNTNTIIETNVFDHQNGTFSVRYTPVLSGEYLLSVQIGDIGSSRHIKDSPFRLTVLPGESDPTMSILVLDDDGNEVAGSNLISSLQTLDSHGNRREKGGDIVVAHLSKVSDEKYQYACGVQDDNTGVYTIECPSQWDATNFKLDVSLVSSNGVLEPLQSSPFNVTVLPGDAAAETTSITSGGTPAMNENGIPSVHFIADAGSWSSFVLSTKDSFGNYLQQGGNHFVTQVDGNISVQVVDQGNGDYIVAYKVGKSSTHQLEIGMVAGTGLVANYYQIGVDDTPVESMIYANIDYNSWRSVNSAQFSRITWIGFISFPHAGQFELELTGVEGQCTLYIGNTIVIDTSAGGSIESFEAMDNVLYALEVEYSLNVDRLLLKLYWSSTKLPQQIVPSNNLFHSSEPIHGSPFSLTVV